MAKADKALSSCRSINVLGMMHIGNQGSPNTSRAPLASHIVLYHHTRAGYPLDVRAPQRVCRRRCHGCFPGLMSPYSAIPLGFNVILAAHPDKFEWDLRRRRLARNHLSLDQAKRKRDFEHPAL